MNIKWTDDKIIKLARLWRTHLPARKIAEEMGTTKSAIIGKANRLGLKPRAVGHVKREKPPPSVTKAIVAIPVNKKEVAGTYYGEGIKSLAELKSSECLWPIGDPNHSDFGFCGAHSGRDVYCDKHKAISFRKVPAQAKNK